MLASEYILWMILRKSNVRVRNSTKDRFVQSFTFMLHDLTILTEIRSKSHESSSHAGSNGHRRIGTLRFVPWP